MKPIAADVNVFARSYVNSLKSALDALDNSRISTIVDVMWRAYENDRQIIFLGNGGSAATASHLATDLAKGALGHRGDAPARPVRATSLTDNVALISAWANDVGFGDVFLGQLRAQLRPGDVVVAISASGNSPNVVRAARFAQEVRGKTISLTGFGGGALAALTEVSLVVDSNHYGIVEDVHLQVGHIVCYYFRKRIEDGLTPILAEVNQTVSVSYDAGSR
jgi:D-sedoheptulose 7-phosphate isomerase